MTGVDSTIRRCIRKISLLRSASAKLKKTLARKVTLEKVLGLTTAGNGTLTCDPCSGLVAYPAGCVVVLLSPETSTQRHIINTSTKSITALSFSPDGKYLVTGESGHLPAVRVWDVAECRQVAELQRHKYGVSCVCFSPDGKSIVSVGNQHDMMVYVWAWKRDAVVAANKVSSKVTAVAFSQDSSYLVTAGNRHVKFWYLDHCKNAKSSAPVPLQGHAGLLGELKNNFFCDVACGRGSTADSTFCITSSGLLCVFNSKRTLDKWVDLRTSAAQSLAVCEELVFCGCADGTVRVFSAAELRFVCTLPRPYTLATGVTAKSPRSMLPPLHTPLGTSLTDTTQPASHLSSARTATQGHYPDTVAVTYDPVSHWLSCVYSDHSLYVWDVRDVHKVATVHSALFHSASVWDLQVCPEVPGESDGGLFFSCSADDTIRLWSMEGQGQSHIHTHNSIISDDLLNVIHKDGSSAAALQGSSGTAAERAAVDGQMAENRAGVRTMCVSPDSKHLASGDRSGILRIHDLRSMKEVLRVHAHAAEILCLEYSKPETGVKLLATAGRDRLVHILDAEHDYALLQTLDEHSASITAIRFAATDNQVKMISCGADKSIYFHTSTRTEKRMEFLRCHHVVLKTTPHDMAIDPTGKYASVGCQDRYIRVFNISSGKQKKLYKGSLNEDGSLLKVQMDPSGRYVATVCSDKNISIVDVDTGECVATMFGHSELVTGVKFTNDCKRLISVSADSCVLVWRLAPELTTNMTERLRQTSCTAAAVYKSSSLRREVKSAPCLGEVIDSLRVPDVVKRRRRHWSLRKESMDLTVKSMMDLRQLESLDTDDHPAAPVQHRDPKRNDNSAQSRREVKSAPYPSDVSSGGERVEDKAERTGDPGDLEEIPTQIYSDSRQGDEKDTPCPDEPAAKVASDVLPVPDVSTKRARRHWSRRRESMKLTVKSMLDLRQLESSRDRDSGTSDLEDNPTGYSDSSQGNEEDTACSDEPAAREATKVESDVLPVPDVSIKRARWSRGRESTRLTVKSMVDLRQLENPESSLQDRDSDTGCNLQDSKQMEKSQKHQDCLPADCVSSHASRTSKETDRDLLHPHWNKDNSGPVKDHHPAGSLQGRVDPSSPDSAFHDSEDMLSLSPQDSSDGEREEEEREVEVAKSMDEALRAVRDCGQEDVFKQNFEMLTDNSGIMDEQNSTPTLSSLPRYLAGGHHDRRKPLFAKAHGQDAASHAARPPVSKADGQEAASHSARSPVSKADGQDAASHSAQSPVSKADGQDAASHSARPPVSKADGQDAASHSAWPPVSKVRSLVKKNSTNYGRIAETNPQYRETGSGWREPGSGAQQRGPATAPRNPTRPRCPASEPSTTGAGVPDRDPVPPSLPQKKRPSGPGRLPNPPSSSRNLPSVVKAASLWKFQSVLSLTTNALRSTAPSADRREALRQRPPPSLDGPPRAASSPQISPRLASSRHRPYVKGTARCDDWSAGGQVRVSLPGNRRAPEKRLSLPGSLPVRLRAVSESAKERPPLPAQRLTATANPQPDVSVNMEACRQAAAQLHDSLKRATALYTKVLSCGAEPSPEQQRMRAILWEALGSTRSTTDSLPCPCPSPLLLAPADLVFRGGGDDGVGPPPEREREHQGVRGDGERTLVLLEKYSELLLKSVEKRLENKS